MEERKITEKESIEVITRMINQTKQRFLGDGSIMLLWGYLTSIVAILIWIMLSLTEQSIWNLLWFAIPLIGFIAMPMMLRKQKVSKGFKTYSDVVSSKLWLITGLSELAMTLACISIQSFTGHNCWSAMLAYCLVSVPFAEIAQGLFIKEKSLVFGGIFGIAAGIFTLCCVAASIPLKANWFMPIFILTFVVTMIVPGHILNYKARKEK